MALDAVFSNVLNWMMFIVLLYVDSIFFLNVVTEWKRAYQLRVERGVLERKKTSMRTIGYDLKTILLTWGSRSSDDLSPNFRPDIILSEFSKCEIEVQRIIRWESTAPFLSGNTILPSVVAFFDTEKDTIDTAKAIRAATKYVSIQVSQILDFVIDVEVCHPQCDTRSTRVFVHCLNFPNKEEEKEEMKAIMLSCGEILRIRFYNEGTSPGRNLVCEADYKYVSHAYVAKCVLDEYHFKHLSGKLAIHLENSQKVREIMRGLRRKFMEYLDANRVLYA